MASIFDKASVVIPTYNKKERLRLVLESFKYQTLPPEYFEIILVDDGSNDGTDSMVTDFGAGYPLRYLSQSHRGRSSARNRGIATAANPLIIFCDDDTIASQGFIESHLSAHSGHADTVIHGKIYSLPYLKFFKDPVKGELYGCFAQSIHQLEYLQKKLLTVEDVKSLEKIESQKRIPPLEKLILEIFEKKLSSLKWLCCTGGNVSVAKQTVTGAGLFDEQFGTYWGAEDLELGYRLFQNGCEFGYCEDAKNYHISHHRPAFEQELKKSMTLFHEKHGDPIIAGLEKLLSGQISSAESYIGQHPQFLRDTFN